MKKLDIICEKNRIGKVIFDLNSRMASFKFNKEESENFDLILVIIEGIKMKNHSSLNFDKKSGCLNNIDENIILAVKQEFFLNLGWILK